MRWILVGALLALLLLFPQLLALVASPCVAILSKPLLVAFVAGLAVRPHLPRMRGWTR